ncbi:hypothetical protein J7K42_03040 [bacterium]|nr:hypothetical protein [bacterium]
MFKKFTLIGILIGITITLLFFSIVGLVSAQTDTQDTQIDKEIRTVTVKVVADEEFRNFWGPKYNWRDYAKEIVERASKVFEKDFGIKFVIKEFEEWESEDHLWADANGLIGIDALMAELERDIQPDECDIVIAFTGQGNVVGADGAVNELLGRYVLVEDCLVSYGWWKKIYKENKDFCKIKYNWETWDDAVLELIQSLTRPPWFLTTVLLHGVSHIFLYGDTEKELSIKWACMVNRFDKRYGEIMIKNHLLDFKLVEIKREEPKRTKRERLYYIFQNRPIP